MPSTKAYVLFQVHTKAGTTVLAVKADVAEEIVYAQEFARTWLSLENEDAEENDDGATRGDFE